MRRFGSTYLRGNFVLGQSIYRLGPILVLADYVVLLHSAGIIDKILYIPVTVNH